MRASGDSNATTLRAARGAADFTPRCAVLHVGARLHYAVPRILAEAGMLQALYTDASASSLGAKWLQRMPPSISPMPLRRLLARRIPDAIPSAAVHSYWRPSIQWAALAASGSGRSKSARQAHAWGRGPHWLAKRAIQENFGGANMIYAHPCVTTDAVREARKRGLRVAIEAISHPASQIVELDECERFSVAGPCPRTIAEDNIAFFKEEAILADAILAASPFVRDGLIDLGLDATRISVVPYGLDVDWGKADSDPVPGRVLFVGNVNYLKGVQYLAEASRILTKRRAPVEVRIVGPFQESTVARPEFRGVAYLGQVPRDEVHRQYRTADVFVFPTLSDGFGLVMLEAMAWGVPVVCTPNCGDLVRDGENGFVVQPRDARGLADRIGRVIGDRGLRKRMSDCAKGVALQHKLNNYSECMRHAIAAV